jgi:hypothetical protein
MKRFVKLLFAVCAAAVTVLCGAPALAQAEEASDSVGFTIGQSGIVIVIVIIVGVFLFGDMFYKKKHPSHEEAPTEKGDHEE